MTHQNVIWELQRVRPDLCVREVSVIGEGVGFIVMRAATAYGATALKMPKRQAMDNSNDGEVDATALLVEEHRLLVDLAATGVPVPKSFEVVTDTPLPVHLQALVDTGPRAAPILSAGLGAAAARLHDLSGTYPFARYLSSQSSTLGERIERRLHSIRGSRLSLPDSLHSRLTAPMPGCVLHMDLRAVNVGWVDEQVVLLDWGNALLGDPRLDLVRADCAGSVDEDFRRAYAGVHGGWPLQDIDDELRDLYALDTAVMLEVVFKEEAPDAGLAAHWSAQVDSLLRRLGLTVDVKSQPSSPPQPRADVADVAWPVYPRHAIDAVAATLERGQNYDWQGENAVAGFESRMAALLGAKHLLSFSSGTAALRAALFALNLPSGSRVVVPSYTYVGTATPLLQCGLIPVFAEVDPFSWTLTPDTIQDLLQRDVSAVIVNHVWGCAAPISAIVELCRPRGIKVIEDAAHVIGQKVDGRALGTLADCGVFSLQAFKDVPAGEGGVLVCRLAETHELAAVAQPRELAGSPMGPYAYSGIGLKDRLPVLQAVLADAMLEDLGQRLASRKQAMEALSRGIAEAGDFQQQSPEVAGTHGYYGFRLLVPGGAEAIRPALVRMLNARGVRCSIPEGDTGPIHELAIFRRLAELGSRQIDPMFARAVAESATVTLPVTEDVCERQISIRPLRSGRGVDHYVEEINAAAAALLRRAT